MNALAKRYSTELLVFGLVFVVVFSDLRFGIGSGSNGNVEQWINLTNQMFYGAQDFLFSYGPLYWLTGNTTSMYNVPAYWLSVIFISFVEAFFWAILFSLASKSRTVLFVAITYVLFFNGLVLPSAFFLWPLVVVAWLEYAESAPRTFGKYGLLLLGAIVGFAFYVRFFFGMIAMLTLGSYFVSRSLRTRSIRELALFVLSAIAGYVVVGLAVFHHRSSVIDYLVINNQLNFGNSVDMTLDVRNSPETFIACALIAVLVNIFTAFRRPSLFLTANALLLVLFKIGFSRTDHSLTYFVVPSALVCCLMLFDASRLGKVLFSLAIASLCYLSVQPVFPGAPTKRPFAAATDFSVPYETRMQAAYPNFKLDNAIINRIGSKTIDVYPHNNEYLFSNRLNYIHRPLFQGYMTLTPKLDAMNRAFFESADRPHFLLWTAGFTCSTSHCNPFEDVDQKFVLNEDPLTTSAILLNYHVVASFPGQNGVPLALFEENSTRVPYSENHIAEQTMRLGQWYSVPRTSISVVKLKPNLKFTLYGRLKNLLFRGGVLKVKYRLLSGQVVEFRTNILNAHSGVWVSPLPDNFTLHGQRVEAVMLETSASRYLRPEFDAQWVSVPINIGAE